MLPLLTNAGGRAQASRCHVRRDEPAPSSSFAVAELEYTAAAIVAVSSQNRRVEPGAAHPSVSCASLLRCSAQVRRASHPLLLSSVTASAATATADAARLCAALAHCRRRAWLRHCDSAERAGQPPSVCSYQLACECKARTKIRSKWCAPNSSWWGWHWPNDTPNDDGERQLHQLTSGLQIRYALHSSDTKAKCLASYRARAPLFGSQLVETLD